MSQWKGRVIATTIKPPLASARPSSADGPVAVGVGANGLAPTQGARVAYFPELGEVEIPVHLGGDLEPGTTVAGPALVIEPETTVVVYPDWIAHVSDLGNYRMELEHA
jgi:N-methylhydantoinase A/oxoprolinase/acetone carboxylase beta subunit